MDTHSKKDYAAILGSATFAHIIQTSQALITGGYYNHDDRDDIIQELTLVCVKALALRYVPGRAERSTFLIGCVKKATKKLQARAIRDRQRMVRPDDYAARAAAVESATTQPTAAAIDTEDLLRHLSTIDRDIVESIARGEKPAAACRRHALKNTYFARHIRPLLKKMIARLNRRASE